MKTQVRVTSAPMAIDRTIRERIRAWLEHYRVERGWSRSELAKHLGISAPTVTNVLDGKRTAGLEVVIRMHAVFKRSADDFLDVDPKPSRGSR